ncbi:MAG: glycosyltransferase family 2 protein [Butyrivibrio sp.]|nr:glycosyltransferase family 2 protein [Butyrivibrio sp.]
MKQRDVTVIIPNYNGAQDLTACLDALATQTYPADVIVVDDASTDESVRIAEAYAATGAIRSLTLLRHKKNRGFAAAVNTGIRKAKTPYVILLNNDAFAEKTFTESLVHAVGRKKNTFAVQAMMLRASDPGNHIDSSGDYFCALGWAFSPGRDQNAAYYAQRTRITSACAGAAIYVRAVFDEIGLFDEAHFSYIEDVDIGLRALRAGYDSFFEPAAVVHHKGSATTGSRYNAFKTRMTTANSLYTAYKNMPAWMLVLYFPLLASGALIKGAFYAKRGFLRDWLCGLKEGMRKISAYRSAGRPLSVISSPRRDALLMLELLGNCARRVRE